jgi:hypothetical protein
MLALIMSAARGAAATTIEAWRFAVAVIDDMRATRAEIEKQYGPLGF